MLEVIGAVIGGFVLFAGGVAVGAHNAPTVDKAIAALKTAEQSAQATLDKITAHKAA